ncbi:palladin-like [Salvelinus alpinus]|uniref:palladin-like n=1 Tax=Salvelinus alpinus TaxID=8036 RepID=UPI0039FCDAFB
MSMKEPPKIIEKPEVINVTLGDAVSLECKVSGTPEIKVKWTKDGIELTPSRQNKLNFENNLSSLKIQSTQLEDAGDYLFEATNSVDTCSCKVKLIVVEQVIAPTFIKKLMEIQEVLGSVVYMECKVAGSLPISVQWTKDGSVLASKTKYQLEQKDNTVSLEIKNFEEEDTGEYLCKITNKAGSSDCSGALKAKGQSHTFSFYFYS